MQFSLGEQIYNPTKANILELTITGYYGDMDVPFSEEYNTKLGGPIDENDLQFHASKYDSVIKLAKHLGSCYASTEESDLIEWADEQGLKEDLQDIINAEWSMHPYGCPTVEQVRMFYYDEVGRKFFVNII